MTRPPRFASVVLDVDSTLSAIEGIDWLAARRGPDVAAQVSAATDEAMRGVIALDAVYGRRLALAHPSKSDIRALTEAYKQSVAPGAAAAIGRFAKGGVQVVLVTGGLREAIVPFAATLGVPAEAVNAVPMSFDARGEYAGFDTSSPLATQTGKRAVVERLGLPAPALAVGDGATDAAIRPAVKAFAAFTGFVTRDSVVRDADYRIASFKELEQLVLG